jgi:geranylgeranyl pyrophosphate synthase
MDKYGIGALILGLPELASWPLAGSLFEQVLAQPNEVWGWPIRACQAVGGTVEAGRHGAAALACLMLGVTLVDDMLDQDPRGLHLAVGSARTANLALALQAAALQLVADAPLADDRRVALTGSLAQAALATAYGQELGVVHSGTEADYWKTVRAKSAPYYEAAAYIGALLGNAPWETANRLRQFGILSGEIVQLHDDLKDAFQTPANPDWKNPHNNLLLLYARSAAHAERNRFELLVAQSGDNEALHAAQQILIDCGAVSYCAYHIFERFQTAQNILALTELADRGPLGNILSEQIEPLLRLLGQLPIAALPVSNES